MILFVGHNNNINVGHIFVTGNNVGHNHPEH